MTSDLNGGGLSRLSVVEPSIGRAEVTLDGRRVEDKLRGLDMSLTAGGLTEVVLHVKQGTLVEFDGYARVGVGEPAEVGPAAAAFLSAISAAELEKAALNRADLGSGPNALTEAMLRQLVEWANGRA